MIDRDAVEKKGFEPTYMKEMPLRMKSDSDLGC